MGGPPPPTTNCGAEEVYPLADEQHTSNDLTAPVEYRLTGYSQMIKTATASGSSARIYVPAAWAGKRVTVILLDPPGDPLL